MQNPIEGFRVTAADFRFTGRELRRPECILAEPDGTLWTADARGGVVRIDPDGAQALITQEPVGVDLDSLASFVEGTLPNGLAFADNGDLLVSNFGTDRLERMTRSGETTTLFDSLDGQPIGKVNFVCRDSRDRIWITVSTMLHDWPRAMSPNVGDGRVLLYEPSRGVRVVAEGIRFANECKLDAAEEYLYVVQTTGRNVIRFRIEGNGDLVDREVYGPADHGRFLDGIAFDAHGNLWGTYIMCDGIFAITPERERCMIFDDSSPEEEARLDALFQADGITIETLAEFGGSVAPWCASLTFGGADLSTVYVGSLRGSTLPHFHSPVAGLPLSHWAA